MANIDDAFRVEKLSLEDQTLIATGANDPTTGAGYNAPVGSLFLRTNGSVYKKIGPNDVDWVELGTQSAAPVFGTDFTYVYDGNVYTNPTTVFFPIVTLNTNASANGVYRIDVSYGWNYNSTTNDIEVRVLENGTQIGELHKQEPKDAAGSFGLTGTNQRHYTSRTFYRSLTAGAYTYTIEFRSASLGTNASIWDLTLGFWRVS